MKKLIFMVGCIVGALSFRQSQLLQAKQKNKDSSLEIKNLKRQKSTKIQKESNPIGQTNQQSKEYNSVMSFPFRFNFLTTYNNRRIDNYQKNFFSFMKPKKNYWHKKFIQEDSFQLDEQKNLLIKNESPFDSKMIQKLLKRESPLFTRGNIISIKLVKQNNAENILEILFNRRYNQFKVTAKYNKENNVIDIKNVVKNENQNVEDEDFVTSSTDPLDFYRKKANILKQFYFPSEETRRRIVQKAIQAHQKIFNLQDKQPIHDKNNLFNPVFSFLQKLKNALRYFH